MVDRAYREVDLPLASSDLRKTLRDLPLSLYELVQITMFEGMNVIMDNHSPAPANIGSVLISYSLDGVSPFASFSIMVTPQKLETVNSSSPNPTTSEVKERSIIRVMIWFEGKYPHWLDKSFTADQVLLDAMLSCVPDTQKMNTVVPTPKTSLREALKEILAGTGAKLGILK